MSQSQTRNSTNIFHKRCLQPIITSDIWCSKWNKKGWSVIRNKFKQNDQHFWDYSANLFLIWIINKNIKINVIKHENESINDIFNHYCENVHNEHNKKLDPNKDIIVHYTPINLADYTKHVKWDKNVSYKIEFWNAASIRKHKTLYTFHQNVKKLAQKKMHEYWNTAPFRIWRMPELKMIKEKSEEIKQKNPFYRHFKKNDRTLSTKELFLFKLNKIDKIYMVFSQNDCRDMGLDESYAAILRTYK